MTLLPDNSLPPADASLRRWGWQNTPGWASGLALILVLFCVILRTGFATRDAGSADETDAIEKTFTALQLTKTAYSLHQLQGYAESTGKHARTSPDHLTEEALSTWRQITRLPTVHTGDWRRLGLALTLFHRPGAAEAFSHIAATRVADAARRAKEKNRSARSRKAEAAEVPAAQEVALWNTLYDSKPIPPAQVADLRGVIKRLNLGWFEHTALAQLYTRAGQKSRADAEWEAAAWSASLIAGYNTFEGILLLLGGIGLLTCGLLWFFNRAAHSSPVANQPQASPANYPGMGIYTPPPPVPTYTASYSPLIPIVPPLPALALPERVAPTALHFSYRARTVAFSVYMAVFMLIGLPFRLLRPFVENWSDAALTRFTTVVELVIYVPVVLIAIWVLRRLSAAESATHRIPTWRETFRTLGMTSQRPLADIGVGAFNYALLMPVFFAVTAFSGWIFRHYHTPINPVQFDSMMAQNNLDRLLLLLVTAVGAPVVEELMFRGLLYPALRNNWGKIGGALLSGAVFAIVHPTIPGGFLPIMLLGVAFAMTYERRGSLLPNIVMHGLHNGLILLTVFFLFAR